ncbi:hypothetical protein AYK86_16350 [Acinetobacter venetianus]|uniref:hypothetical protein n=1 Tax=Acinetobacter venetianus TaxID=52133 RepID=UPI0007756430|nr:hypothetical protein [Acinetobacter venetianus]KXO85692.1 hypothetical protein AYK86_16350 [Acinetobacter venetianus]
MNTHLNNSDLDYADADFLKELRLKLDYIQSRLRSALRSALSDNQITDIEMERRTAQINDLFSNIVDFYINNTVIIDYEFAGKTFMQNLMDLSDEYELSFGKEKGVLLISNFIDKISNLFNSYRDLVNFDHSKKLEEEIEYLKYHLKLKDESYKHLFKNDMFKIFEERYYELKRDSEKYQMLSISTLLIGFFSTFFILFIFKFNKTLFSVEWGPWLLSGLAIVPSILSIFYFLRFIYIERISTQLKKIHFEFQLLPLFISGLDEESQASIIKELIPKYFGNNFNKNSKS